MIIDMHIHIASINEKHGCYVSDRFKKSLVASHFYKALGLTKNDVFTLSPDELDDIIIHNFLKLLHESKIDKVMLLGLDYPYKENGEIDMPNAKMVTSADFLKHIADRSDKIIIAPSVHPYRKDALEELERVKEMGAKVIKWIPAAMNIKPESKQCLPFYQKLVELDLPLITHTCIEHAVVSFSQKLNHVKRLELALKTGVKVIAAHCATNLFIYERTQYYEWKKMAKDFPNLYGDISAFNVPTRIKYLKDIKNDDELRDRVFYGSDFPMKSLPISFLFYLGYKNYRKIKETKNPLDMSYNLAHSFFQEDKIFKNFQKFLNIEDSGHQSF